MSDHTNPRKRVVGAAIQTNPLVAVAAGYTPEQLTDLDEEIEAAEKYLAGLRAIRAVATAAGHNEGEEITLALPASRTPPQAQAAAQAATQTPPQTQAATPDDPPHVVREAAQPPTPNLAEALRRFFADNPDAKVNAAVEAIMAKIPGLKKTAVQASAYNVRSRMRKSQPAAQPLASAACSTPPGPPADAEPGDAADAEPGDAADAEPGDAADAEPDDEDEDDGDAEPEGGNEDAGGMTKLEKDRRAVAEILFKQGLADVPTIISKTGISAADVGLILNNKWFERHADKWRLTKAGRQEGVDL